MDGSVVVEADSIANVLAILLSQRCESPPGWERLRWLIRYLQRRIEQFNPRGRARRNAAHHYDLDDPLYALFLDADRQYSCAYFESPQQSLDDAQLAKKRRVAAKLLVPPHGRVLDIGCGWGGLALYLAELCGARVTGITLSQQQLAVTRGRAAEKGLADKSSACRTIATCRGNSIASFRWVCSSMSASASTPPSFANVTPCSMTTA